MAPRRTAIQRTQRILLLVLAVLFLVLLGTGIWLSFRYQPSGSFQGARPQSWVRVTHRTTSGVFVVVALATFGLSIAVSIERALKRGFPAWVLGLAIMIAALAAAFSGYLLPWDQLALAPIRPGEYQGYNFLFGHPEVRFVLLGSVEIGKDTLQRWFFAHAIVIPLVAVALAVAAWRITRRSRVLTEVDGEERT